MPYRFFLPTVSLIALLVISSCAPAAPALPMAATAVPATATPADLSAPTTIAPASTQAVEMEVQAVATSRGPNLEATDPATVSLASGQLQLVEFFRFT